MSGKYLVTCPLCGAHYYTDYPPTEAVECAVCHESVHKNSTLLVGKDRGLHRNDRLDEKGKKK